MDLQELKRAYQLKVTHFKAAEQIGKPRMELLHIYRQLKDLQYKILMLELNGEPRKEKPFRLGSLHLS